MRTQALICSLPALSKGALGFPKEFEQSSVTLFPFILTLEGLLLLDIEEIAYKGDFDGTSLYGEFSFPGRPTSSNTIHRRSNLHLLYSW